MSDMGKKSPLDFTRSDARIAELLQRMNELADLGSLGALAGWDQNTALPDGAGEMRAYQLATLQGVLHDRWTDPRIGQLLDELARPVQQAPFNDLDRGLVREVKRAYDQQTKLPKGLVEEMARTEAQAFEAWRRAKAAADFAGFAPWLTKVVGLQREVADRLGYTGIRYNALLDLYEPAMTADKLDALFGTVRDVSIALLRRIQQSGHPVDDSCLKSDFPREKQLALADKVLRAMSYDFNRGGIAVSPHPFTTSFGSPFDVRVTVRPDEHFMQASLMAAVHEGGHAVYEQGSAEALARTPLAGGASLGVHESQSRLWENGIGRSHGFWKGQYHLVREVFPEQFANVDVETFWRALNKVEPSLIRVEADEVTYNLHIIIRYELEKGLVDGTISVEELPRLWDDKYEQYLGIRPPTAAEGVLQDIHWTSGFGYFPTYTLGNLYGAQILATLKKTFPDFDDRLAQGDTNFAWQWLRENLYEHGSTYLPDDLIARVTGEPPTPTYFADYLNAKYAEVYQLPPAK
jgi:carboxypeptidase Taq